METVQIPTKLRRNAPCPCGSGRKFKKCCEQKEQKMEEGTRQLKNEFRDQIRDPYAGIPQEELVKRDQVVLMEELRFRIDGIEEDRNHIKEAINKAKALRMELLGMPKSKYREECLQALEEQIKHNRNQINSFVTSRKMEIMLLALEKLFSEVPDENEQPNEPDEPLGPLAEPDEPDEPDESDIPDEDEDEDEI